VNYEDMLGRNDGLVTWVPDCKRRPVLPRTTFGNWMDQFQNLDQTVTD